MDPNSQGAVVNNLSNNPFIKIKSNLPSDKKKLIPLVIILLAIRTFASPLPRQIKL